MLNLSISTRTNYSQGLAYIPCATVAADNSVADSIAEMRDLLSGGKEIEISDDGTIKRNSTKDNGNFKPVPPATVAAEQWYEKFPEIQAAEINAMKKISPSATWGYLNNGSMYWKIHIRPTCADGVKRDWIFLAVYDSNHPHKDWGGSVKFYPVSPNYDEMMERVNASNVSPKTIPHLLLDKNKNIYMCTQHRDNILDDINKRFTSAATCLRFAMRWVNVFELGLLDQITWDKFHRDGEI